MAHAEAPPSDALRWLRFVAPRAAEGARRFVDGSLFVFASGDWRDTGPPEEERASVAPMPRATSLLNDFGRLQRERVTDFSGVLPDEYAVEVTNARGETRVDYKGVPIKNADGTLNKYGKALIEAHETPNRRESELAQEIHAVRADEAREQGSE